MALVDVYSGFEIAVFAESRTRGRDHSPEANRVNLPATLPVFAVDDRCDVGRDLESVRSVIRHRVACPDVSSPAAGLDPDADERPRAVVRVRVVLLQATKGERLGPV